MVLFEECWPVVNSAEVVVVLWHDVERLCRSPFLVGATASCAVAGCARGAQRSRSGLRR